MSTPKAIPNFVSVCRKIVAVGRNFRDHAAELKNPVPTEPVLFFKPPSAFVTEGQPIKLPHNAEELHHEVELGVVIGQTGVDIPEEAAMNHVAGYTLALDMTDRQKQSELKAKSLPWALCKGFDTSCPVSRFISRDEVPALDGGVRLWLKVNGEMRQDGSTSDMIFSVPFLVSWISKYFRLEPGDLILTGTPAGVGPVRAGDEIHCGLGDVVSMKFPVMER